MEYLLSSPTSSSLASSPGFAPTSTILLENENDQETAITSPTNRSRHTKSEHQPETTISEVNTSDSEGTTHGVLQEPSDVYYARTTLTHADPILLDQSLFTAEPTQMRLSLSASEASSGSSGSPLSLPSPLNEISVSSTHLDHGKEDGETAGDVSSFRRTLWLPRVVLADDDDEESVASFPTTTSSSTGTTSTATTTPARFTAEEKGKSVDRSGREWTRNVEENHIGREIVVEEEFRHKRTRSTGVEETKLKSAIGLKERSHRRSTSDDVRHGRRRKIVQEDGISRDFVLLVALCVGFACAGILIVRTTVLALNHGDGLDLYFYD